MRIPRENVEPDCSNPQPLEVDLLPCDVKFFESVLAAARRKFGTRKLTCGQMEIIRESVAKIQDQFR